MKSVKDLLSDVVYAGFSYGGASALLLAGTRSDAKGCLLFYTALPLQMVGILILPMKVLMQAQYAHIDPWRNQSWIDQFVSKIRDSGAGYEFFECPVAGHLFTEPDLREYYADVHNSLGADTNIRKKRVS